ncbi:HAD-like domain-containing protein [Mycena sp. CBHHK59/15]|nr:HAD-like domain-containing protein [Mycena sp. CBHHK59/15]
MRRLLRSDDFLRSDRWSLNFSQTPSTVFTIIDRKDHNLEYRAGFSLESTAAAPTRHFRPEQSPLDGIGSRDRPSPSPDRTLISTVWTVEDLEWLEDLEEEDDWGGDDWDVGYLPVVSEKKALPPPPAFEPHALQVLYFDVYGTLIDNESGIFDALEPLLARSPYRFDRREALSFYFESEVEVKRRTPSAPYSQILADAHDDMALRLGLSLSPGESTVFAASAASWPLHDGALWCLQTLRQRLPALVGILEVDETTARHSTAFATLAPYLAQIFTWDVAFGYKPDLPAFFGPLTYHDERGVPRARRCLVSNGLLRDLEPARELGLPAVWLRFPGSLAANAPNVEYAAPCGIFASYFDLVTAVLTGLGPPKVLSAC